jgi:hypothetical protein
MSNIYEIEDIKIINELKNSNNNFYNNVYLCIQNNYIGNVAIDGFNCKKFDDFEKARDYYNNLSNDIKIKRRVCFIPVFKYAPITYNKYILKNELRENYWKDNVTILFKNKKKD